MSSWQNFILATADNASTVGGITAVSRISTSMEVWWVRLDGSVQGAFWYEGGQWGRYELALAGSASSMGGITAVSRIPTSMEVWWMGQDGSVQDAFWYEGSQWQRFTLVPTDNASTTGGIKAVSRISTSMEMWWIRQDGSVQDAFWYDGYDDLSVQVETTRNQLGGDIHVFGGGFAPKGTVRLSYVGLAGRTAPLAGSAFAIADATGKVDFWDEVRCWPNQQDSVTVVVTDQQTGRTATGSTYAFSC